jgi:hypothetical protein
MVRGAPAGSGTRAKTLGSLLLFRGCTIVVSSTPYVLAYVGLVSLLLILKRAAPGTLLYSSSQSSSLVAGRVLLDAEAARPAITPGPPREENRKCKC